MIRKMVTLLGLSTIILIFSFKGGIFNIALGQAVPLIPLSSGNLTLDKGIPLFYKCIQKEVKGSANINEDPYFKSEPTKEEVFKCYNSIFAGSVQKHNEVK